MALPPSVQTGKPNPIYKTPARYRLLRSTYINDLYHTVVDGGPEVFVDYDGHPGTGLEPTDAEGKRRQDAYFASKGLTVGAADAQKDRLVKGAFDPGLLGQTPGAASAPSPLGGPVFTPPAPIAIPENWNKPVTQGGLNAGELVLLAHKLGAPDSVNTAAAATEFIKAEIAKRMGAGPTA